MSSTQEGRVKVSMTLTAWGSATQAFYRPGPNPTVDIVVTHGEGEVQAVLLVRRKPGTAEGGKWALPGGFHNTAAPKGSPWRAGAETSRQAALRELREETQLDASDLEAGVREIGIFDRHGRDPRDNAVAWSVSSAFALHLTDAQAAVRAARVVGSDDVDRAEWVLVKEALARGLAFDHADILRAAGLTLVGPSGRELVL